MPRRHLSAWLRRAATVAAAAAAALCLASAPAQVPGPAAAVVRTPIGAPGWSIALHYGAQPPLEQLRAFDVVVVEPDHAIDPGRHLQRSAGRSELFAYLSIGEMLPSREAFARAPRGLMAGTNATWGGRVIDQAHPQWPAFLVEQLVAPLWEKGYRGFFLDTMDSYQLISIDPAVRAAQEAGLVRAVEALKARFPEARLIVNRGFEVLPAIRHLVSAVAAESLYAGWDHAQRRHVEVSETDRQWLSQQLARARDALRLPAIAIDYVPPGQREAARATARRIAALGITPYVTDPELATIGVGTIEVLPRRVLVLHDAPADQDPVYSDPHRFLAMPLQYLGYRVELWNINERPPPTGPLADRYAGVVGWFNSGSSGTKVDLGGWIRGAREQGLRLAFFNNFGVPLDGGLGSLLGVSVLGGRVEAPLRIVARDPMIGHEIEPTPNRGDLQTLAVNEPVERLLQLADARGTRFDAAAITSWGGFVLAPFAVVELRVKDQHRWAIQPIRFLRQALALPEMPVPDPTTEAGRRLLLIHVDGDGFASRAELPGAPLASEVMLREFIARYPVPHTISVIQGETAASGVYASQSPALEDVARRIFAMPNVEIASHSYSHPFNWRAALAGRTDARYNLAVPDYTPTLEAEIVGSARYIDSRLAPPGKRTTVFLWTGDCVAPAEAIQLSWESGLLNMNGGDTTISRSNPSWTAVAPLSVRKNGWLQVLAPNQNENVYTNLWTGPFYGYERVIETFELTDRPYRFKPVNIYYHTFAATKPASIAALRKVYDWAQRQPLFPVHASEYIRKVADFEDFVVARSVTAPGSWKLVGDGALQTVRAPAGLASQIDWQASRGVAGVRAGVDGTYVHLVGPVAHVVLATGAQAPGGPMVVEANGRIEAFERDGAGMRFRFSPHSAGELVLAHADRCTVTLDGQPLRGRPLAQTSLQSGLNVHSYATPPNRGAGGALVSVGCQR